MDAGMTNLVVTIIDPGAITHHDVMTITGGMIATGGIAGITILVEDAGAHDPLATGVMAKTITGEEAQALTVDDLDMRRNWTFPAATVQMFQMFKSSCSRMLIAILPLG